MTEKTNRDVNWNVDWAVFDAERNAVDWAVNWATYWVVWRGVDWAVTGAVDRAMHRVVHEAVNQDVDQAVDDPDHPTLQDFLFEARNGAMTNGIVNEAVIQAVRRDSWWVRDGSGWWIENWSVFGAVDGAMWGDSAHPGLQDFLRSCGARVA